MANIKSAKKRILVNESKRAQNKMIKSELGTLAKKFKSAVTASEMELAKELYKDLSSALDKASLDNIIHKNKANRDKARFAKMLSVKTAS